MPSESALFWLVSVPLDSNNPADQLADLAPLLDGTGGGGSTAALLHRVPGMSGGKLASARWVEWPAFKVRFSLFAVGVEFETDDDDECADWNAVFVTHTL